MSRVRILIAAGICIITAAPAQAAQLVTPPIYAVFGSTYQCSAFYRGASRTALPLVITARRSDGTQQQIRTSVSASRPMAGVGAVCEKSSADPQGCLPLVCVFSFSLPAADLRTSACVQGSDLTCVEGR